MCSDGLEASRGERLYRAVCVLLACDDNREMLGTSSVRTHHRFSLLVHLVPCAATYRIIKRSLQCVGVEDFAGGHTVLSLSRVSQDQSAFNVSRSPSGSNRLSHRACTLCMVHTKHFTLLCTSWCVQMCLGKISTQTSGTWSALLNDLHSRVRALAWSTYFRSVGSLTGSVSSPLVTSTVCMNVQSQFPPVKHGNAPASGGLRRAKLKYGCGIACQKPNSDADAVSVDLKCAVSSSYTD